MLSSTRELATVLMRVSQKDEEAFELLYRATCAKLYGVIVRILTNRSVADEVLQEVYVKVWQRAGDYDPGKASPISWMAAIARNRALDEARRASHTTTHEDIDDMPDLATQFDDPLRGMERSDQFKALVRCLGGLDTERREILLLAYYRGMSREALAERFGRPTATVKTWLHRSLAQLRTCLAS